NRETRTVEEKARRTPPDKTIGVDRPGAARGRTRHRRSGAGVQLPTAAEYGRRVQARARADKLEAAQKRANRRMYSNTSDWLRERTPTHQIAARFRSFLLCGRAI